MIVYRELNEARVNTKGKAYKEFVQGAEFVSKAFGIKLTPTSAVGMDTGQGVPIYEINSRDLDNVKKNWDSERVINGYEFRTFRQNRDGSFLIFLVDGSKSYPAMVAEAGVIENIISNVTWNDMDVQVMLGDFLKSIGTKLGKDDVIIADTKESRIQIGRWYIIQLAKARTGKYGDAVIKDIKVNEKFLKAELMVDFDGFEVKVLVDTKYTPNVSAKKIGPFVDEIYKAVGIKGEDDVPKSRSYSVSTLVSPETLAKMRKVKVHEYLSKDMFIVYNGKDELLAWHDHTQLTFVTPKADGTITFINKAPAMHESIPERETNTFMKGLAKDIGFNLRELKISKSSSGVVFETNYKLIDIISNLRTPFKVSGSTFYIESIDETYGGIELVITNGVQAETITLTDEPEMFESKGNLNESTNNWNRKFTSVPPHML